MMSQPALAQVELPNLLFGMSWEDPASDRRALQIRPGETIMAITSGGCNTLSLLLENPQRIYAIDINACQSHLLELKRAAIRHLDCDDLHAFLGLRPSKNRLDTFEALQPELSQPAIEYWTRHRAAIREGVMYQGRYERFLRHFRRLLRLLQGPRRIEKFFDCQSLDEQQDYFNRVWNTSQWRTLFRLAFNKRVLAKRGLSADYFRFDADESSFVDAFFNRAKKGLCQIPISTNYFVAQYMLGRYTSPDAIPDFLRRENLSLIRERLDCIEIVTADASAWLATHPESSLDGFSLSNICELMSPEATLRTFEQVARTARPGARICFRNLMVPREVPQNLTASIQLREELSRHLLEEDRSFVYSRVQAYVTAK